MTKEPLILDFGKYKGMDVEEVPASYLLWLYDEDWVENAKPELYKYIHSITKKTLEIEAREEEADYDHGYYGNE